MQFEDVLSSEITRPGTKATQSYVFLAPWDITPINIKDVKAVIREQHFDAILVARLTKAEKKTTYVEGQVYSPYPYYGTFAGYYGAVYPLVYSPGYLVKERIAQVEWRPISIRLPSLMESWSGPAPPTRSMPILQ